MAEDSEDCQKSQSQKVTEGAGKNRGERRCNQSIRGMVGLLACGKPGQDSSIGPQTS